MKIKKLELPERRFSLTSLGLVIGCAFGLWWFFPREDKNLWRFSPDVSLPDGNSRARSVLFSPDGHTLAVSALVFPSTYPQSVHASGSRQRRCEVQLWDVPSRQRKSSLVISDADVPRGAHEPEMAFSPDGRQLRFWGISATTWDIGTATLLSKEPIGSFLPEMQEKFGLPQPPWKGNRQMESDWREVAYSNDRKWCVAAFLNSRGRFSSEFIRLWRRVTMQKPWQEVGVFSASTLGSQIIHDVALSRDGKLLAVALYDGSLQLFDTARLRLWKSLPSSHWIIQIAFSPDNRYLLGCGGSDVRQNYSQRAGILDFWNVDSGVLEHTVTAPQLLRDAVFSADGKLIAAIEGDETVFVSPSPLFQQRPRQLPDLTSFQTGAEPSARTCYTSSQHEKQLNPCFKQNQPQREHHDNRNETPAQARRRASRNDVGFKRRLCR